MIDEGDAAAPNEDDPAQAVEFKRVSAVSGLSGYILIGKYKMDGRIVEVETAFVMNENPTLDLSAGWRVMDKIGNVVIIQRMMT